MLPCRRISMKAEESSIPAGRRFLPGNTAESMRRKQLEEADPKAAERLLAYIMRKKGMSISMCQVYKDSTPNCVVKHGLGWGSSTVQTE